MDYIASEKNKAKYTLRVLRSFITTIKVSYNGIDYGINVSPEKGTGDSGNFEVDLSDTMLAIGAAARDAGISNYKDNLPARFVTSQYSYRLLMNYGPPTDWKSAFQASFGRIQVIAGEKDELMDAPAYKTNLEPLGAEVTIVPGVDHMGIVYRPAALAAIVAAAK